MTPPRSAWPALALLAAAAAVSGAWRHLPPLNDDWIYRLAADRLAADGVLRLTGYGAATQVLHVAGAAVWSRLTDGAPWGLYSLAWAAVAVWNLCAFLDESGAPRAASALAGSCLALCPVALVSLPSLMTELPNLALGVLCVRALARGAAEDDGKRLLQGGAWAAAAYLVRQPAVGLPLGAAWALWRARRLDARRLAALWGPMLLAALGHAAWQAAQPGTPAAGHVLTRVVPFLQDLAGMPAAVGFRSASSVATLGLFALPLAAALPLRRPASLERRAAVGALAVCAAAVIWRGPLPLVGNILSRAGIGAVSVPGFEEKAAGLFAWPALWWALTAASAAAAALCAASGARAGASPARDTALGAAAGQVAVCLLNDLFLDRYLLAALPGVLAAAALGARDGAFRPSRGWAAAALLSLLWGAGLADHVSWNEARWRLSQDAAAVSGPCAVNGGYEWNAFWCYEGAMSRLAAEKDPASAAPDEWFSYDERRAFVSFAAGLESSEVVLLGQRGYATPLAGGGGRLYLYALRAPWPQPAPPPHQGGGGGTGGP